MSKIIRLLCLVLLLFLIALIIHGPQYIDVANKYKSGDSYTQIVEHGPKNNKIIALTFDDGPHSEFTPQILDLLKEYDVKATFFVLGKHVELYPHIVKREIAEGHEVGNHSYSHIDVQTASEEVIREEFGKTQELIFSISNIRPTLIRPPFGFYNNKMIDVAEENNCIIVLWSRSQDSKDWSNPGVDTIAETVISKTDNGDIILLHDRIYDEKSDTVEALKIILPKLVDRGYKFVTVSELLELSPEHFSP